MQFSAERFNRHLDNMGQRVLWARAWACPCRSQTSGSADPACPMCVGRGRVWDEAIETVVGVCNQQTQLKWARMGMWEAGDMVVSLPEESEAWDWGGMYDRVITLNGLDGFSDVYQRGAPTERLRLPVNTITRVYWLSADRKSTIEGAIPDLDDRGRPSWPGGVGEPPVGTRYSITGDRFSEYFMHDSFPSDRNEHKGMRLPKRVVLRKFDLLGRAARTPA